MSDNQFNLLNLSNHFDGKSMLDNASIIMDAKSRSQSFACLIDAPELWGATSFIQDCARAGVKPIVGVKLPISLLYDDINEIDDTARNGEIILIAKNEIGYKKLVKLCNEHVHSSSPVSIEKMGDDILIVDGFAGSSLQVRHGELLKGDNFDRAPLWEKFESHVREIGNVPLNNYILAIDKMSDDHGKPMSWLSVQFSQRHGGKVYFGGLNTALNQEQQGLLDVYDVLNTVMPSKAVPATVEHINDALFSMGNTITETLSSAFLSKKDSELKNNLLVKSGDVLANLKRVTYLASMKGVGVLEARDMQAFSDISPIFNNLNFTNPIRGSDFELVKKKCTDFCNKLPMAERQKYFERLEYEYNVIQECNFTDYFVFIAQIADKIDKLSVKKMGRGSAVASLVVHALGYTIVDPVKEDLLFDRFLSSNRSADPDIDIDLSDAPAVHDELSENFDNSYMVASNQRIKSPMGRASIMCYALWRNNAKKDPSVQCNVDTYAKSFLSFLQTRVNEKSGAKKNYDLDEWFKEMGSLGNKELITGLIKEFSKDEEFKRIFKVPEGRKFLIDLKSLSVLVPELYNTKGTRTSSIIFTDPNFFVTDRSESELGQGVDDKGKNASNIRIAHLTKDDSPYVKLDLLPSKALKQYRLLETMLDVDELSTITDVNDGKIYQRMNAGKVAGIFQFNRSAGKSVLKALSVKNIDDLTVANALIRDFSALSSTGELQNIGAMKNRYQSSKDPSVVGKLLDKSYGMLIYDEQLMKIAMAVGDFTGAQADQLRTDIKKLSGDALTSALSVHRKMFVNKAIKLNYTEQGALSIFEKIEEKANTYIFNEAHSRSYALLAHTLAYAKFEAPMEFYESYYDAYAHKSTADEKRNIRDLAAEIMEGESKFAQPSVNDFLIHGYTEVVQNIQPSLRACFDSDSSAQSFLDLRARQEGGVFSSMFECNKCLLSVYEKENSVSARERFIATVLLIARIGGYDELYKGVSRDTKVKRNEICNNVDAFYARASVTSVESNSHSELAVNDVATTDFFSNKHVELDLRMVPSLRMCFDTEETAKQMLNIRKAQRQGNFSTMFEFNDYLLKLYMAKDPVSAKENFIGTVKSIAAIGGYDALHQTAGTDITKSRAGLYENADVLFSMASNPSVDNDMFKLKKPVMTTDELRVIIKDIELKKLNLALKDVDNTLIFSPFTALYKRAVTSKSTYKIKG
jgi:hypothetical protein